MRLPKKLGYWFHDIDEKPRRGFSHTYHLTLLDRTDGGERKITGGHLQVVTGRLRPTFSARFSVGTSSSETPWDASLNIAGTGLYLGLGFGGRLASKLSRCRNPQHRYEGRSISLFSGSPGSTFSGTFFYSLWTHTHSSERGHFADWREGSFSISPAEWVWGHRRFWYETTETAVDVVSLPEGEYTVNLELQRQMTGRVRGRRRFDGWVVRWDAPGGIPTELDDGWKRGSTYGSSERITNTRAWVLEATNRIAAWALTERGKKGFRPEVAA